MSANKQLVNDGYCVLNCSVKNEKLIKFRKTQEQLLEYIGIRKHEGIRLPFAFKAAPYSINIFDIYDGLKAQISEAVGIEDWVLTGHCDLHKNALSGWHRDDGTSYGDGGYFAPADLDYATPDKGVFKVAVYLQEHESFTDGLTIEPGSHTRPKREIKNEKYMKTSLGQVIIFDQRLWHAGQLDPIPLPLNKEATKIIKKIPDLKFKPDGSIETFSKKSVDAYRRLRGDRMSVFFTIRIGNVPENHPSVIFEKNNMRRQLVELATNQFVTFTPTAHITNNMKELALEYGVRYSEFCEVYA